MADARSTHNPGNVSMSGDRSGFCGGPPAAPVHTHELTHPFEVSVIIMYLFLRVLGRPVRVRSKRKRQTSTVASADSADSNASCITTGLTEPIILLAAAVISARMHAPS